MQLSTNFSLRELTRSAEARRLGIANIPDREEVATLAVLCNRILEPCRDKWGKPITPSSGYRCAELCRAIGSTSTSAHTARDGLGAVDFEVVGVSNLELAEYIRDHLDYDTLIIEGYDESQGLNSGWVHASFNRLAPNRKRVYHTHDFATYHSGLS